MPQKKKKKKKRQRKSRCSLDPSVPCVGFWGEFNFSASVSVLTSHAPPCWVSGFICPCLLLPFSFVGHICPVYVTYCMWLKPVSGFNRRRVQCWTPPVILCASLKTLRSFDFFFFCYTLCNSKRRQCRFLNSKWTKGWLVQVTVIKHALPFLFRYLPLKNFT